VKTFSLSSFSSLTLIHLIVTRITFISQFSYSFVIFLSCSACSPHSPPGPLLKTAITIRYLVTLAAIPITKGCKTSTSLSMTGFSQDLAITSPRRSYSWTAGRLYVMHAIIYGTLYLSTGDSQTFWLLRRSVQHSARSNVQGLQKLYEQDSAEFSLQQRLLEWELISLSLRG